LFQTFFGWAPWGAGEWTAGKAEKVLRADENLKPATLLLRAVNEKAFNVK
jgi:hypothetical protein